MAVSEILYEGTAQVSQSTVKTKERKTGDIDKESFLKLLVTQLRYQDPLKPMEDKEFLAQMAQFSALEQMQNLNASFSVFKAFNLIGKHVVASIRDSSTNNLKTVDGVVSGVKINAGTAYVVIGSEDVPVDNITSIANDKASPKSE